MTYGICRILEYILLRLKMVNPHHLVQQHAAATPELQIQYAVNLRLYCPSDRLLTTSIVED